MSVAKKADISNGSHTPGPAHWYLIRQNYIDAVTGEARRVMFPSSNLPASDAYPIEVIGQFTWDECQERMRAWMEAA